MSAMVLKGIRRAAGVVGVLLLVSGWSAAADRGEAMPPSAEVPPPPPLPGPITEADLIQPEVVVREEGENLVTEYRVGGKPYLIKVTPPRGEPYFLIDKTGEGSFERLPGGAPAAPPMWVIRPWR